MEGGQDIRVPLGLARGNWRPLVSRGLVLGS